MKNSNKIIFKPIFAGLILPAMLLSFPAGRAEAQLDPGGDYGPTNTPIESWSFSDYVGWTDDDGFAPLAFTNLNYSVLGNGKSLVVDTNIEAFLQYPVWATDGWTNLTVDNGSVTFWFAANWNSVGDTNGGAGPGDFGRLLETGHYTDDSSYGWWSIFLDSGGTNLYFAAQTNDLSSSMTVYLHTPIDWTTNYFHFIAVTYSPTSSCMYVDGVLMTNGPGVTVYPGPEVLTNGFWVGSDSNGTNQSHGLFNTLQTYNYPLNSNDVATLFNWYHTAYIISPWNTAMFSISSSTSSPSLLPNTYNIITGQGGLQYVSSESAITSSNVWITNVVATVAGEGVNVTFTIQGGYAVPYDVFANSVLDVSASTNGIWAWLGQGYHGNTYTLTNLPLGTCFLRLGGNQDSDFDGLTDAYERLVSKTDPYNADTDGDGISDSDEILNGTDPLSSSTIWRLDTDNDGLPDQYEDLIGWNPDSAEAAPGLPTYSTDPIQ